MIRRQNKANCQYVSTLVGLDPGLGTATLLREGTNFGRGCSFSFSVLPERWMLRLHRSE